MKRSGKARKEVVRLPAGFLLDLHSAELHHLSKREENYELLLFKQEFKMHFTESDLKDS